MAKFEPGHMHIERHALTNDDVSYNIYIDYEVTQDPKEGKGMLFKMHGTIFDKPFEESFYLPKDQAYNFASNFTKVVEKYGIPKIHSQIGSNHKYYDEMFADVRVQLNMQSGDPVKPEHLG
jgi:hypothetical protein